MSTDETNATADFLAYHQSLARELNAVKDRVRNLIQHWATDGSFKEAALRTVLRRHLPETLQVGTGFIVNRRRECSTQIDLLIVDRSHPTLFKDGDLLIVTPSAVRGIIEVKTTLSGPQAIQEALNKVTDCKLLCQEWPTWSKIFTGLFVYEEANNQSRNLIQAVKQIYDGHRGWIDALAYGPNVFGMFHESSQLPGNIRLRNAWSIWSVPGLAPAYFLGSILSKLSEHEVFFNPAAWFPGQPGNVPISYTGDQAGEVIDFQPPTNSTP
jgi:hypothetical protein